MFGFLGWTVVVATLVQGYSAKSVRLEVQIYRWKMTEEEVAKAHFPYGIPKDAKPDVSIEFDAVIGEEQHIRTKVGNRTVGAIATVSGFDGSGFFARFAIDDRTDTDGFPSAFQGAGTEIAIWPGQRCVLGGSCQSNTSDGKTEAHGDAITVRMTRPILPLAEPISRPASAQPASGLARIAGSSLGVPPVQSLAILPASATSSGGCGTLANLQGAWLPKPISNARR